MKRFKQFLCVVLVMAMCFSTLLTAYAAEGDGAWYDAAVSYVTEQGLMEVTDPDADADRLTVVEARWQAMGRPEAAESAGVSDVEDNPAVDWAAEVEIIVGYNGRFNGSHPVSREQLVTMLWRYEGSPVETRATFTDTDSISSYASMAVTWAQNSGIVSGVGGNRFNPAGNITQAQLAQVLMNCLTREDVQEPGHELPEIPEYAAGALSIARQGMFSSGGTVTEPVSGEFNSAFNWMDATRAGNTAHVDYANVLCQIPESNTGNPIVYLVYL